ncbi:unnamed protein product [Heligmosomoides polygyrus]|uniref:Uncharacterized protein n=1 Tax=Heligmosomoides polygyrus TaxID=6339 RepID=A0A3P7ZZE3_HELPZ|nr:unnamed protein product [Heligmosomoides polygyrus]
MENLNITLQQVSDLLKTIEIAILIIAVSLAILLVAEFLFAWILTPGNDTTTTTSLRRARISSL